MDTKIGSFKVPPASLPIFLVLFIIVIAPIYDHFLITLVRKLTKTEMGISHLKRIGIRLALPIQAMAVAALVKIKRKRVALHYSTISSDGNPLPIFFSEAPPSVRSLERFYWLMSVVSGQ